MHVSCETTRATACRDRSVRLRVSQLDSSVYSKHSSLLGGEENAYLIHMLYSQDAWISVGGRALLVDDISPAVAPPREIGEIDRLLVRAIT